MFANLGFLNRQPASYDPLREYCRTEHVDYLHTLAAREQNKSITGQRRSRKGALICAKPVKMCDTPSL